MEPDRRHGFALRRAGRRRRVQETAGRAAESQNVPSRLLEAAVIVLIMSAFLVGGRAWVNDIAQFHGLAISVLGVMALVVVYAFRRNFLAGGPQARLHASRDAAFLAAIAAAIVFVAAPSRWSLGATIVAVELGLVVELFSRWVAPPERTS
jgi:hypothetical protein